MRELLDELTELAIETALSVGHHIIASAGFDQPTTYAEVFRVLGKEGVLDASRPPYYSETTSWTRTLTTSTSRSRKTVRRHRPVPVSARNCCGGRLTGRVFEVSDTVWGLAVCLQGAHAMLDDLTRTFDVDPVRS